MSIEQNKILSLSIGVAFEDAIKEWQFADYVVDHGRHANEQCQLCNHSGVRYHYLIKNKLNSNFLYVGSDCILIFNLDVVEDGVKLDNSSAKIKLHLFEQEAKHRYCIKMLKKLACIEKNDILLNAVLFYKTNNYLTPKMAFVILWRLQKNDVDYIPSMFKISIKTKKCKEDLLAMNFSRIKLISESLSASQKQLLPAWMQAKLNNKNIVNAKVLAA